MKIKMFTPAVLASALLLTLMPRPVAADGPADALTDLSGHWAEAEIRAAADAGWVNGDPDGTFRPEGAVTRAEFLKMLSLVQGGGPVAGIPDQRLAFLADRLAETGHWAATGGYVTRALALGALEPSDYDVTLDHAGRVASWSLSPDTPITRLDAAVLITRTLGGKFDAESFWYHPGSVNSPARLAPESGYTDAVPQWAPGWVAKASESGLVNGYPDGTFRAGAPVKRAEAVVMLRRMAGRPVASGDFLGVLEGPLGVAIQARDGLSYLNFTPVLTVRFAAGATWDETAKAWAALSRADRAAAVEEQTRQFWADSRANQAYFPLAVRSVMVTVEGQPNQSLGEGHLNGLTYEYLDVNGMADPARPAPGPVQLTVVPGSETLPAQFDRYLANAKTNDQATPPSPVLTLTFPYQYLGDWFRADSSAITALATTKAREYFQATQARLAAIGVPLDHVTVRIAPADTADRAGQYRGLLIGETLLTNSVFAATYDGQDLKVTTRPPSLRAYVDGLSPKYEQVPMGEAGGGERMDPAPEAARQVMESFIYSLGRKPAE